MKQVVYYQISPGNWARRIDERPFLEYWFEQFYVFRDIELPFIWRRIMRKLGIED